MTNAVAIAALKFPRIRKRINDDEERAFDQVLFDRRDRRFDQTRPIVDGPGDHAVGQRSADLLEFGGHPLRDRPAVLADQQHRGAKHHLFPVHRRGAGPQILAFPDVRDVGNPDRYAVAGADHDFLDFLDIRYLPRSADEILLAVTLDVACADVGVVRCQRRHHFSETELVGHQLSGIRQHVKLLFEAADGVDLDHPGNVSQLRLDDPVLDRPQITGRVLAAARLAGLRLCLHGKQVNLAQARRHRPHGRFQFRAEAGLWPAESAH